MTPLRLGVIGLSPGNGHPYSWSAIFNGYDHIAMEQCGFPVIPRYLEEQSFPESAISEAEVTHVWAQDRTIAEHIGQAALIGTVVNNFTDMIGHVDGVLLARDDVETHFDFAAPFLEAGIPIYVDKPLALTVDDAMRMIDRQQYPGQLFSCSALKYAPEFHLSEADRAAIGRIHHIQASVPKDWNKYAIHAIEPALLVGRDAGSLLRSQTWQAHDITNVIALYESGLQISITSYGALPTGITMLVHGDLGSKELVFRNTFRAFKAALSDFVQGILSRDVRSPSNSMVKAIQLVEAGRTQ